MLFADDLRIQNTGTGAKRIYRRINTKFHDRTIQYGRCVKVGKCRRRSRVRQVVGRHINRLNRRDRTIFCRCNTFLQSTHFRLKSWLVTNGTWHTSKKCGHLGTRLCETENIVNEQEDIFSYLITEILCHRKSRKTYTHTRSGRLIHLSEYHRCLIDNSGFNHFIV